MLGGLSLDSKIYAAARGANDKVRVGIIGFSDRCRSSLIPCFMANAADLGFETILFTSPDDLRRILMSRSVL